ncbi:TetR/AcrR family transcriptional regulator [Mariniluteicoccus flavus]
MTKRGPRSGEDTRGLILTAARQRFAEDGYSAVSLRAIARDAGVDPALVHHYFAGKEDLFNAAVNAAAAPGDPVKVVDALLATPREHIGRAALRSYLTAWEDPAGVERYLAIVRASTSTDGAEAASQYLGGTILADLTERLGADQPERRAATAATILMGVGFMRHVVRRPGIVDATLDELLDMFGPAVDDALVGALPAA